MLPVVYQYIKHVVFTLTSALRLLVNIIYIIESKHFKADVNGFSLSVTVC